MTRPVLLDLFCGAGGAAMGYHRAGFDVVGVDINPQPNYPFEFIQEDALKVLDSNDWDGIDVIHASPPCQHYTKLATGTNSNRGNHPDLINEVRELLIRADLPYVIENVDGSKVRRDITLCGEMFGLAVIRHRHFESNVSLEVLPHKPHRGRCKRREHGQRYEGPYFGVYGHGGGRDGSVTDWQKAMDIPWITSRKELVEAIPPAYTMYIGAQLYA